MKLTAKMIGKILGHDSREVNKLLHKKGFLDGKPGEWVPTKKSEGLVEITEKHNGYGGSAARKWSFLKWDENIIDKLKK